MLQLKTRKILNEAETAFRAMTIIETFAVENKLPPPVKPADYVNILFHLCLELTKDAKPDVQINNNTESLFYLNMELLGIEVP